MMKTMLADLPLFDNRKLQAVLILLTVALLGLTAWRVHRNYSTPALEFNWEHRAHSDFHNGTYLPTLAFRNGDNPYGKEVMEKYTMPRSAPPYSPSVFILHLPFSFLSLNAADIAFFVYNAAMLLLLGFISLRCVDTRNRTGLLLLVFALLLISRPGHMTLFTGYFTAELAVGTAIALGNARSRPVLAGLGLLLASGKPNFILPLILLMLCRRDFKAVFYGVLFSGVFAIAGFLWLASFSSPLEVFDGIREGLSAHEDDPTEHPWFAWTRTDVMGMACKLTHSNPGLVINFLAMLFLLIIPGAALWRLGKSRNQSDMCGLTGFIISLSILLSIYHHTYDCLLLIVPWVGVTFFGPRVLPELTALQRWVLVLLTAVPAANYLSTLSARDLLGLHKESWLWQSITLVNSCCLLAALVLVLLAAFRLPGTESLAGDEPTLTDKHKTEA